MDKEEVFSKVQSTQKLLMQTLIFHEVGRYIGKMSLLSLYMILCRHEKMPIEFIKLMFQDCLETYDEESRKEE